MNISEEKEHIYSLMREITEERRQLTGIYFNLKERLDELHKIEQRGLTDLSLKGYIDLHNSVKEENNKTAIRNIERESRVAIKKINREHDDLRRSENNSNLKKEIKKDLNSSKPKGKRLSTESLASIIAEILRDNGVPMSLVDLHESVVGKVGYSIKLNNFRNNIIHRVMQISNKIERASRGYYQYKF